MQQCLWFIFHKNNLVLCTHNDDRQSIFCGAIPPFSPSGRQHAVGVYNGMPCIAYTVGTLPDSGPHACVTLRESYSLVGKELYLLAGKGAELIHWDAQSQYCSFCGTKTAPASDISKSCANCGNEIFPVITTAVLVLVQKENTALLVRALNFRGPFHGLVAGFLEPGETLEECSRREVLEETGLTIDAPRYFGCQPWPYPSGLMVGFTANYQSGELTLQQTELASAAFYARDSLPPLPSELSLARQMIDWWRAQ